MLHPVSKSCEAQKKTRKEVRQSEYVNVWYIHYIYPCKSYVSKIHPQARGIVVQEDLNESEEEEELSKLVFFGLFFGRTEQRDGELVV